MYIYIWYMILNIVYEKTTYIAVSEMPENFDSRCTFKESRVIFTVTLQFQTCSL